MGTLLERAKRRAGKSATISEEAMAAIRAYEWPGNVRELENAIERAAVLSPDGVIRGEHITRRADAASAEPNGRSTRLADAVAETERDTIRRALESVGGNRNEAAKLLGVSVRNLFYKIKQLGI